MNRHNEQAPRTVERDECPLCGASKPKARRCCGECRSVMEACAITERQALEDAKRIRAWKVRR